MANAFCMHSIRKLLTRRTKIIFGRTKSYFVRKKYWFLFCNY